MKAKGKMLVFLALLLGQVAATAQPDRWQQAITYDMEIDFDVQKHQFTGKQTVNYTNNSPDTLHKVFYHLYFNAFQPNSMMDVRSRTISDPDGRVRDRIAGLDDSEIGYLRVQSLQQNGRPVKYETVGTILEVELAEPIFPHTTVSLDMVFDGQVPLQIRRSGRDNQEGIAYSMAQWYPKMCEYDYQGWHANPYVGREFYGVWGDFDVRLTIDKDYVVAATGYLQNPDAIGHGYGGYPEGPRSGAPDKLTWHFVAPNVHDFLWAADPDYTHTTLTRADGNVLHFFYQKNERTEDVWARLPAIMDEAFAYINTHFGQYQYQKYSFIQGGDGGMEYPMATLITGERNLNSLVGVSVHELMHSWYQMMLGTNESLYSWMDEGFTSYASSRVMNDLAEKGLLPGRSAVDNPHLGSYAGYLNIARSDFEEPLTTHADHFVRNRAYGVAAYSKGAVFLHQLEYIIGEQALADGLLRYFNTWKSKHPNVNDFIRIMEKTSGLELDWYKEYFVQTIHTIDYGITSVREADNGTEVVLERVGVMPMPIDLEVTYRDGTVQMINMPLRIMRGHKPLPENGILAEDWPWTHPTYILQLDAPLSAVEKIVIDPSLRMADINRDNNTWEAR